MGYNSDIEKMQRLIAFNQKTPMSAATAPILEHSLKAANGNTYGVLRECGKYHVMVAPPKNSGVMVEDFSHIGGENNSKEYEYSSYTLAVESLEHLVRTVNAKEGAAPVVSTARPLAETKDWQTQMTKETREEIERFREIDRNISLIENKYVPSAHTLPEAPAKNPSEKEVNSPFTDTAVAKGDKDFTVTNTKPETAGAPFDKDGKATNADMQSDKKAKGNTGDEVYSKDAQYVPNNSVADQKPTGGKVTRADESRKRTIRITEAQAQMWQKINHEAPLDTSKGTEIGDTAPFVEKPTAVQEGEVVHTADNQNTPKPGTSEVGDTAPFDKKVNEEGPVDASQVVGMPDDLNANVEGEEDFEGAYNDWLSSDDDAPFISDDMINDVIGGQYQEEPAAPVEEPAAGPFGESRTTNEGKVDLGVGKHPAYQKPPMTTPANKEVAINGAHEPDDDSVKNDKPFGQEIGDTAPYTKLIDNITDSIMEQLMKSNFSQKA